MKRTALLIACLVACAIVSAPTDIFARARMFHPGTGRFMQRDPNGTANSPAARNLSSARFTQSDPTRQYLDGANIYLYARSNPRNRIDPWGLESIVSRIRVDFGSTMVRRDDTSIHANTRRYFVGNIESPNTSTIRVESKLSAEGKVIIPKLSAQFPDSVGHHEMNNLGSKNLSHINKSKATLRYNLWKKWGEDADEAVHKGKGGRRCVECIGCIYYIQYEDLSSAVAAQKILGEALGLVEGPKAITWVSTKAANAIGKDLIDDNFTQDIRLYFIHIVCADGKRFSGTYNLPLAKPSMNYPSHWMGEGRLVLHG